MDPHTSIVQFLPESFWTTTSLVVWVFLTHVTTIGKAEPGQVGVSAERIVLSEAHTPPRSSKRQKLRISWSSNEPYRDRTNRKIRIRYGTPKVRRPLDPPHPPPSAGPSP